MSGLLAVAWREVRERRIMLLLALAFGFVPLLVPRIRWVALGLRTSDEAASATANLWAVVMVVIPFGFAIALGSSIVARDIGERRLGFYFARPLAGLTVFTGKMLAAVAIVLSAFVLAALPVALTRLGEGASLPLQPELFLRWMSRWGLISLIMFFFMAFANAVAGAFRARSGLLIVDVIALPSVLAALGLVTRQLFEAGAESAIGLFTRPQPSELSVWSLFLLGAVIFSAAGAAQVAVGRADARRGHRALSSVIWSALTLCVAAYFFYARWVLAATPRDLLWARVDVPASGRHLLITGSAKGRGGYWPTFLLDTAGSTVTKMPRAYSWLWAEDGAKAVAIDPWGSELVTAWLGEEVAFSRVSLARTWWGSIAVSPQASRILVSRSDRTAVLDVATGRELASLPLGIPVRGFFRGADVARAFTVPRNLPGQRAEVAVQELDVRSGATSTVARISVEGNLSANAMIRFNPDGTRILLRDDRGLMLLGGNGQPLAALSSDKFSSFHFLHDGRVAVAETEKDGKRLRLFGSDGKELRSSLIAGGGVSRAMLAGESAPGVLNAALFHGSGMRSRPESLFVDAGTGEVGRREPGLFPAAPNAWVPGSIGTRLFWTAERGDLVWFDPATGERRVMIAGFAQEPAR